MSEEAAGRAGRTRSLRLEQEEPRESASPSPPAAAVVTAVVLQGHDHGNNMINGTSTSTKSDQLPDYKDQSRRSGFEAEHATIVAQSVHAADEQQRMKPDQLPSYKDQARRSRGENATILARSVHAVEVEDEPAILPARVMQTFPPGINAKNTVGSRSADNNNRRRSNHNSNSNYTSSETQEPDYMERETKRRKRIIWGLVVVSVAIVAGVAIAVAGIMMSGGGGGGGGGSSSDGSSSVELPPSDSSSTSNTLPPIAPSAETLVPSTSIPLVPPTEAPTIISTLSPIEMLPPSTSAPVSAIEVSPDTEVKLTASDAAASDQFGFSLAFNGETIVVGSWNDDTSGSAYVYSWSGTVWTEQGKLTASEDAADERFGYSVAINDIGDTIVIGAYQHTTDSALRSGCAFVYTLVGAVWTEQAKLMASDADADDRFGYNVAINEDTIVIGAFSDDDSGIGSGSAYVYIQSGSVWTEQAKLTASDGANSDEFGLSVAISRDTIVIGAWYDDTEFGIDCGSAYVYTRSGTAWTEQAKLTASDGAPTDQFGLSVAISGDIIVIGANWDDTEAAFNRGSAYVYIRSGTVWTEQAKLAPSDGAGFDSFGYRVATDGANIAIGAYGNDGTGSAYVYTRSGTIWTEQAKLTASDGAGEDLFGISVAIAGGAVVIGASSWDSTESGIDSGSVYIFS